jgi:hypothetical protein
MAQASHAESRPHLQKVLGAAGYTNSGSTVTVSRAINAAQLAELTGSPANVRAHEVTLVGGAVTMKPV